MSSTIDVYQGDSYDAEVLVVDQDGVAKDITGSALVFTVRINSDDVATVIQRKNTAAGGDSTEIEDSDPENGKFKLHLTTTNTEQTVQDYVYDFQMTIGGKVYTILKDVFTVKSDVT